MTQAIAFYVLSLLALVSAVVVITQRKPVISALALAFNLISIAGFFILLNAPFMAMIQVIVYAGAIMVLILFVIMLLNLLDEAGERVRKPVQRWGGLVLAGVFSVIFAIAIASSAMEGFPEASADFGTAAALGNDLFTYFFYPFEAISLLLVVAMIGAVLLAKRRL